MNPAAPVSRDASAAPAPPARASILGVAVSSVTMSETLSHIACTIESGGRGAHLGVNAANLVKAQREPDYASDLRGADLLTADGQSVVWASRVLGAGLPERVTGIDLMTKLVAAAPSRGWKVFLLGASPAVVSEVARRLIVQGVAVVGAIDGYFPTTKNDEVAAAIAREDPDLVFVGMPSPRKERFIVRHALPAGVRYCVGVGGTFDVLAGRKRRAPALLQRAGLEWTVRLAQEPRRLAGRYTVTSVAFARMVLAEWLAKRRRS